MVKILIILTSEKENNIVEPPTLKKNKIKGEIKLKR